MATKPSKKRITTKAVQAIQDKPVVLLNIEHKPEIDQDAAGDDGLNMRQRLFVQAITGPALGNATKAAEMAGYAANNRLSLKATACENLTKPYIQKAIAAEIGKKAASPEWAVNRAYFNATADMSAFLGVGEDGEPTFDWAKAAAAGAIGHVREWKEDGIDTGGGEGPSIIKRSFKLIDSQKALDTVLKLQGKLKDSKININNTVKVVFDIAGVMKKLMADPLAFDTASKLAERMREIDGLPSRN